MNPVDMSWVTDPLDELTSLYSGLFLAWGNDILWTVAVIVLIVYAFKHGIHGGLLLFLFQYVPMLLLAANLLKYYSTPLPWTSVSLHQLFPSLAQDLANTIDMKRLDVLFDNIGAVLLGLQKPGATDFVMFPFYWMVEFAMWIIQALLFALTATGFVALGIGNLLGPIFIPWIIVPRVSFLFWNWLQYIWQYSFYRVVAAALSFVFSTVLNNFMSHTVHGDYTLAHWMVLMPKILVFIVAMAWMVFRATAIVSDLFKGTSSGGSNMGAISLIAKRF